MTSLRRSHEDLIRRVRHLLAVEDSTGLDGPGRDELRGLVVKEYEGAEVRPGLMAAAAWNPVVEHARDLLVIHEVADVLAWARDARDAEARQATSAA